MLNFCAAFAAVAMRAGVRIIPFAADVLRDEAPCPDGGQGEELQPAPEVRENRAAARGLLFVAGCFDGKYQCGKGSNGEILPNLASFSTCSQSVIKSDTSCMCPQNPEASE